MGITFVDLFRGVGVENARMAARLAVRSTVHSAGRLANVLFLVWQVRHERNQLARLSRVELAEMGIHPGDAGREVERGLFDLPKSRLDKI